MKKVICIIVTYNGSHWIRQCLDSLARSQYPVETVVIDNASTDDTSQVIRKEYSHVRLLENRVNQGFGGGNNIGLALAVRENADYVFLLNQDATVEERTVGCLLDAAGENPDFGILSPLHLNGTGKKLDLYFAAYLSKTADPTQILQAYFLQQGRATLIETQFVNAAAWLVTAECLRKTGGFDPIFFHYGEDDQYAQRALFHGFKIGIVPNTSIGHHRDLPEEPATKNLQFIIQRDWVYFLTHACNINRSGYFLFMVKRALRHAANYLQSLLKSDRSKKKYHGLMAVRILRHIPKVRRSRRIVRGKTSPYLINNKHEA